MILLTIHVDVLKKNHSEFLQTLASIGNEVRKLPGCLSYQIHQDVETESMLSLELEWDHNDALRSYLNSRNFSITMGAIKTFCVSPIIKLGKLVHIDQQNLLDNSYIADIV